MAELVDALDLKSSSSLSVGSTPVISKKKDIVIERLWCIIVNYVLFSNVGSTPTNIIMVKNILKIIINWFKPVSLYSFVFGVIFSLLVSEIIFIKEVAFCFNIKNFSSIKNNFLNVPFFYPKLIFNHPLLIHGAVSTTECEEYIKALCNCDIKAVNIGVKKYNLLNGQKFHRQSAGSHYFWNITNFGILNQSYDLVFEACHNNWKNNFSVLADNDLKNSGESQHISNIIGIINTDDLIVTNKSIEFELFLNQNNKETTEHLKKSVLPFKKNL